ncbi:MAG: flagellar biosynthetic protein FliR [Candidatus Muirbacterium halophilum]|nr:flagellar biosynthetic protein FliR [Candidatus Muirbacterium halophilum]MCK9476171.1 flagellar biosynthetic protein FliR [Candidatus Muirbacterium halophilum]
MNEWVYNAQLFALVIVRVTSFFYNMPIFGGQFIPNTIKITASVGIALIIFPLVPRAVIPAEAPYMMDFALFVFKEFLVGFTTGFMVSIFILGIRFSGILIGQNMGLMMANVVDPESNEQVSILEQIHYFVFLFVFLSLNGHLTIVKAIVDSYSLIPAGGFSFHSDIIIIIVNSLSNMFTIGFNIAMPVFGTLMIVTVLLGFIAKVAQKIQVMLLSFPLKIVVGIIILTIAFPVMMELFFDTFDQIKTEMYKIMQAMY